MVRVKPRDEDFSAVVMDGGDQPEVVSGDVEDHHGTAALDPDKVDALPGFADGSTTATRRACACSASTFVQVCPQKPRPTMMNLILACSIKTQPF